MNIEKNKNLKEYNTFMIPAICDFFADMETVEGYKLILKSDEWRKSEKKMIIGSGSNILFTKNYAGFILKNSIKGIDVVNEDDESIYLKVSSGENWHDFVMWSVKKGYWGIENLAYIPGTVGAAPVQNIGAYGSEVSDSIESVEYIDIESAEKFIRSTQVCEFSYRNSWFKKNPNKVIITAVYFKLSKNSTINLSYGRVKEELEKLGNKETSSADVATVIINIRKSKLPELGEVGMAGSFFKNPVVDEKLFFSLKEKFSDLKFYELENSEYKIPAGWLLEKAGYRNFKKGNVGNYEKHALIVTHNGEGNGEEVFDHVNSIIMKIEDIFGITLEAEVNII